MGKFIMDGVASEAIMDEPVITSDKPDVKPAPAKKAAAKKTSSAKG